MVVNGWHESESCGSPRWTRNMWPHAPGGPHIWLCVGNDGGRDGRVAVWGGSGLDEVDWSFGGSCVHELERGLEFADVIATVIESKPRVPGLVEWDDVPWSDGRRGAESRYGDLHLAVNSWRTVVMGRQAHGTCEGLKARDDEEEIVDLWGWWMHVERPGGGMPWIMKSWAAWREPEVARAHAEQIARALVGVGFGLEEVLR